MYSQPTQAGCLQSGARIGPYTIVELLSPGLETHTAVYKAKHNASARIVVLKVASAVHGAALRSEASIIEQIFDLRHRNIVKLIPTKLDTGDVLNCVRDPERNMWYFAMEYLPGGSLADWMVRRKRILLSKALEIIYQVGAALDAAHQAGILHLDVKPSNILFRQNPEKARRIQAVLTDFGIARLRSQRDDPMHWLTPEYAAPEQAINVLGSCEPQGDRPLQPTAAVGAASDFYSLMTILYEMLSGRLPFEAKGKWDYLDQVVKRLPRLPARGIPPQLAPVIAQGLSKFPPDRYPTAVDMARALKSVRLPDDAEGGSGRRVPGPALALFAIALGLAGGLGLGRVFPLRPPATPAPPVPTATVAASPTAIAHAPSVIALATPSPQVKVPGITGSPELLR